MELAPKVDAVEITINGLVYDIPPAFSNAVVIDLCTSLGFEVPRFCYHEELLVAGNCRMCLIEDTKAPKPVVCCAMQVASGLEIYVDTLRVKKSRESVLEFLLINHPLDCPICDQGGECDLQDLTLVYGADKGRFYEYKRDVEDKNCGLVIKTLMNRCILCTRCIRFAVDIAGYQSLGLTGRGMKMEIGTYVESSILSDLSGNLVDVCPVGALTSKPYAFVARSWEVKRQLALNIFDDDVQFLRSDVKENQILRLLPAKNLFNFNNPWVTDRVRFSHEAVSRLRLTSPSFGGYSNSWSRFLTTLLLTSLKAFSIFAGGRLAGSSMTSLLGPLPDARSTLLLKRFISQIGSSYISSASSAVNYFLSRRSELVGALCKFNNLFIFLGVDLMWQAPLLSLQLTKSSSTVGTVLTWRSRLSGSLGNLPVPQDIRSLSTILRGQNWLSYLVSNDPGTALIVVYSVSAVGIPSIASATECLLANATPVITYAIGDTAGLRTQVALGTNPVTHSQNDNKTQQAVSYNFGFDSANYGWITSAMSTLSIYQGHHLDDGGRSVDFIAPAQTSFENQLGSYYNSDYTLIKPLNVITYNSLIRSDSEIVSAITVVFAGSQQVTSRSFGPKTPKSYTALHGYNKLDACALNPNSNKFFFRVGSYRTSSWKQYYTSNLLSKNSPTLQQLPMEFILKSIYVR